MNQYIDILEQRLAEQLGLTWNPQTERWDCVNNVNLYYFDLTRLPLNFGVIRGDFDCESNRLITLKGSPTKANNFNCSYNELTSLEWSPKIVKYSFWCDNNKLTSLQGAPKKVGGYFNCNNNQLSNLIGSPHKVGFSFNCSDNKLTSLLGAPQKIGGSFICSDNLVSSRKPEWLDCKNFIN